MLGSFLTPFSRDLKTQSRAQNESLYLANNPALLRGGRFETNVGGMTELSGSVWEHEMIPEEAVETLIVQCSYSDTIQRSTFYKKGSTCPKIFFVEPLFDIPQIILFVLVIPAGIFVFYTHVVTFFKSAEKLRITHRAMESKILGVSLRQRI